MPQDYDAVSEGELQSLYTWVDEVPLSRPKRNIARDFSDGEVVHHFFPRLVELHNYSAANGLQQKMYNWNTLNQKVFKRLGFTISRRECEAVSNCQAGAIESLLKSVKGKISKYRDTDNDAGLAPTMPPPLPPTCSSSSRAGIPAHQQQQQQQQQQQLFPPTMAQNLHYQVQSVANQDALVEKEQLISELRETNEILETKVRKLEQLVRLKDAKVQTLMAKLQGAGMA